jgi:hypothetical protein
MKTKNLEMLTPALGLWNLGITEITTHNLESSGRDEVNKMLSEGWILLHVYTLKYHDESDGEGTWRERPMVVLGKIAKTVDLASV